MSISAQRAWCRSMSSASTGSSLPIPPRVSSENTTPNPKVSEAAFCSQTVMSTSGRSGLTSAEKYRPPGPPPTTAIFRACVLTVWFSAAGGQRAVPHSHGSRRIVPAGLSGSDRVGGALLGFLSELVAESVVLELAAGILRQLVDEADLTRVLVRCDLRLDEVLDLLDLRRPGFDALADDDEGRDQRASGFIGFGDDGAFEHIWVFVDRGLDLGGADVVTRGHDHVVAAGLVDEVAVLVAVEGVAGDVPPVDDVVSLADVVEVTAPQRSAHGQAARLVVAELIAVLIEDDGPEPG